MRSLSGIQPADDLVWRVQGSLAHIHSNGWHLSENSWQPGLRLSPEEHVQLDSTAQFISGWPDLYVMAQGAQRDRFKRWEMEAVNFLRPGPGKWHSDTSAIFCGSQHLPRVNGRTYRSHLLMGKGPKNLWLPTKQAYSRVPEIFSHWCLSGAQTAKF